MGVVYFFFSTACGYCNSQAAILEKFHQDNPNITVVGAPFYPQIATHELVQDFASRNHLTFQTREDGDLVSALGSLRRHPAIAFQSASGGRLVLASNGVILEEALTKSFQNFISGGSVTPATGPG